MSENTPDPTRILDAEIYRDLFERRTVVLGDALGQDTANRLCASVLLLSARDPEADIVLLINSPGGSVPGMLAIRDCLRGVPNDVATVNLGMAYSAGQFLLSSGTPGKRYTLPHSKVLLHQGSGGIGGTAQDIEIQAADITHTRDTVLGCISDDTGRPLDQVTRDSLRDRWFTAEEAKEYGFVDHIVSDLGFLTGPGALTARRPRLGLGA
ncbi:ClpP family protease [Corynebacterium neomassiliense]|uniref:ClpP family protease n=1 Tax=Corynebacterium neomassiliense TaxID=2079482 RepID=UPI00102F52F3|nr:ATP-dependent Clp protease proteolytic subunit [Corynebacterium neomassiliense]